MPDRSFFNGVYKQPIGTTILDASVRDEGHMFHEKRTPSRSSASTKSHPDIVCVKMGGGGPGARGGGLARPKVNVTRILRLTKILELEGESQSEDFELETSKRFVPGSFGRYQGYIS